MKAVVYDHYGPPDVLHIEDIPTPAPRADEVLIRIHATTVNRLDCHTREANRSNGIWISALSRAVSGVRRPRRRILGTELAGEVAAAGSAVTQFAPGDRVFARTGLGYGAHAEFICLRETDHLARIPDGVSFEEAAPICDGALNALWCLRPAQVRTGMEVLVYGASGAIGSAAVQLAGHLGASVTAVCGTANLDLVRSLGADRVIDYTQEDFTRRGQTYDVIFDAVGKETFTRCRETLRSGGCFLAVDGFGNLVRTEWSRWVGDKRVIFRIPPRYTREDIRFLRDLVAAGEYRPVVDRVYRLEQIVEATRYVETGQKTGNVVITLT